MYFGKLHVAVLDKKDLSQPCARIEKSSIARVMLMQNSPAKRCCFVLGYPTTDRRCMIRCLDRRRHSYNQELGGRHFREGREGENNVDPIRPFAVGSYDDGGY
ncbi:hypothetical protein LOAG_11254 [Loa loa]|uniref:Uncharacterized protein n=1 Tax=Loa loa TaxID=7209 RepID=A0A1S0TNC0_LOALO|nr:hypothetical protein LOAG_11254 [Loa loa]EFO17247.2 hypothetical protein LOAG_11254 [Loa loa]